MIKYFKELLSVLKSIDSSLKSIKNSSIIKNDLVRSGHKHHSKYVATNPNH